MKVLICGGHMTPAIALIEELKKEGHELVYVGRKSSLSNENTPSVESNEIPKLDVKFISIDPPKWERKFTFSNITQLAKAPKALKDPLKILRFEKPDVVVSFGSYVAVPISLASWVLRIPVLTHEQTVTASLSNRIISQFAKKVAISWPETAAYFPKSKTVLTGNPIREGLIKAHVKQKQKVVYVTGGNQGSHVINEAVMNSLESLLTEYTIYHQVGSSSIFDDFTKLTQKKNSIDKRFSSRYHLAKWFSLKQLADIYSQADVVIGRSGANTVTEVAAAGLIGIFVPIPWASQDEQTKNAQILVKSGSAMIINQDDLTPASLSSALSVIYKDLSFFRINAQKNKNLVRLDAAQKLASLVNNLL